MDLYNFCHDSIDYILERGVLMFFERTVRTTIENINATFPVLLVTGPRQVGKSTLLESMMEPGRKKVSLDNPTIRAMAISDPELFLQRYSPPVLIDEAQYAPELFPYIKILVDERKRPGDFWLTGSQMFRMMKNVTESLACRVRGEKTPCKPLPKNKFMPVIVKNCNPYWKEPGRRRCGKR